MGAGCTGAILYCSVDYLIMNTLYLYLNLAAIALPLLLSFDRKVAFYKEWKYLFPSILLMAMVFLAKDALFTRFGIWGFNDTYLLGIRFWGLPLEEWMFFFTVPYSCVFIYACLKAYLRTDPLKSFHRPFAWALVILITLVGAIFYNRLYPAIIFPLTALLLVLALVKRVKWLSIFLLSYFISLIPFMLLNGVLTGSFIENEVVYYNPEHILNVRIFTIPIEDAVYNLMMLLSTVWLYEYFRGRWARKGSLND